MVPHDQQLEVASPGMMIDDLDSVFAITKLRADVLPALWSLPASLFARSSRLVAVYAENELPQPQDFVEFGFTKMNPCCIRVS